MFNGIEQKGTRLIMAFYSSLKFELNGFLSLFLVPRMFVCGLFWMLLSPILDVVWFQVEFHHLICGKISTWDCYKALQCIERFFSIGFIWLKQWQIILNACLTHSDNLTTKFVINKVKDYPSFWSGAMSVGVRKFETFKIPSLCSLLLEWPKFFIILENWLSLSSQLVDFVPFRRCQMSDQRHSIKR